MREYSEIFTAIKNDDVKFFKLVVLEDNAILSLCFGRFPILSLCYLFKSKKIIRKFEKELILINNFKIIYEPFEAYNLMKNISKRAIRLYAASNNIITPLEALALLNEGEYLKKNYSTSIKNQRVKKNIEFIFSTNHKVETTQKNDKIYIKKTKINKLQLLCLFIIIIIATAMIATPLLAYNKINSTYGIGSYDNPLKISSEKQLVFAIENKVEYIVLTKDVYITSLFEKCDLKGFIDGKGHSFYVSNPKGSLFEKITGGISNVNFVINEFSLDISSDYSIITNENNGILDNLKIDIKASFNDVSDDELLKTSIIALTNNKDILNCTIDSQINFDGNAVGDAYFSNIAYYNLGNIKNCKTTENSYINTNTIDIGGLVVENSTSGVIDNCINNSTLSQNNSKSSWSPNIGGIVAANKGNINFCTNNGKIEAYNNGEGHIITGGITTENTGNINYSTNNAKLKSETNFIGNIYSSGIACFSEGNVTSCVNNGEITTTLFAEGNNFTAGLVADNGGNIKNSYNNASISAESYSENYALMVFLGGISAVSCGNIEKCKNDASLFANSKTCYIYVGGIAGYLYTSNAVPKITNCASYNTFDVNSENKIKADDDNKGILIFIGGIVARCEGSIESSYSYITVKCENSNVYIGGIISLAQAYYTSSNNNYYVESNKISIGIAALRINTLLESNKKDNDVGVTALSSFNDLKNKEVYWE